MVLRVESVPFDEAIVHTRGRGIELPDHYYGTLQGVARAESFSVAGLANVQQLTQVRDSLRAALENGEVFAEWKAKVRRGEIPLDLPDYRLENIYRTNIQGAYARGRCQQHDIIADRRPWLLYSAVNDSRTRPAHAAMHGTLLHRDDPWWATHRPPNGYQCRCTVIALTEAQVQKRGGPRGPKIDERTGQPPDPDNGWDYDICGQPRAGTDRAMDRARSEVAPDLAARLEDVRTAGKSFDPATWGALPNTQRGTTPGGMYDAPDGTRHYVKFPEDAASEAAAGRLFERMGVPTLNPAVTVIGGQTGVATQWVDGLTRLSAAQLAERPAEVARVYVSSVLTGHPDPTGYGLDNLMLHPNGSLVLVDAGGAFVDDVALLDPLRSMASDVFNAMLDTSAGKRAVKNAARTLRGVTPSMVRADLLAAGVPTASIDKIVEAVEARRLALMEQYGISSER